MYLTRQRLAERAQAEGIPLTLSRIKKEAWRGNKPPVAAKFGRQELYEEADALAWAKSILRPAEAA
jgi:hypothetical protein